MRKVVHFMKKIKVKKYEATIEEFEFLDDCERLKKIFAEHDYDITLEQARMMWELHSEDCCAGWLCLGPSDDGIFKELDKYYLVIEE